MPETFAPPLMNASGFGGWTCPPGWDGALGAFITNPLSASARSPARPPRYAETPCGVLLHTAHPNPGLRAALRRYADAWARSPTPVWVHLLAEETLPDMLDLLEESGCAAGVEVRLPPACDAQTARRIVRAAWGALPLMVQVPWEGAEALAAAVCGAADGVLVSLGAPRGALPLAEGRRLRGRLYGPAGFPAALELTLRLSEAGIPLVARGASTPEEARALLEAGALGVQLDLPLWGDLTFPAGWSLARR